ncbi:hypothetical protein FRC12_016876 [Ceratobasidium sp. 428]|nr:hypothetical protein FRC12_016876 [Ceratobasidium sp. 428]
MKRTYLFALAALVGPSAAQLRSFAGSLDLVDDFWRDLQTSVYALSSSHPRHSFHRRIPGRIAKRCVFSPNGGLPGTNATSTTYSSSSTSPTSTRSSSFNSSSSTSTRGPTSRSATLGSSSTTTSTSITSSTSAAATPSSTWKIQTRIAGAEFFDAWTFWSHPDLTGGAIDYQTLEGAQAVGLIGVNDAGNAVMRLETTSQVTGNRKSVRINSNYTINGGLVILDAVHMPYGCGTWPAFWTTNSGSDWPANGEIDIVEGFNGYTQNLASLHTKLGCKIPKNYGGSGALIATGDNALDCANQGCGQLSSRANNYGKAFNYNNGGVYAMKWDTSGISVFFFPREAVPSDITFEQPMPSTWGMPVGNWPAQSCDPFTFMKDHVMVFNIALCGELAESNWNTANVGGQGESCAASTRYNTCVDYIRNEGAAFEDAYWEVKSVKVYT